ncbi:hypothetical protein BU14_0215s0010 [Porphyra umbilicalis]|uniref:Uncharacterized protein n=1 Tax=Porphyra umbilicalis TaxID=2786 RepID=A0A1X6P4Y5_PORUM|nr:hypothetical protein BU14_0215s0010 [Porphyra umbilicalis]|eukprot:OSX75949.1 hypothetical protein BU14_0215s0010 [Porphyra umbilicalis]
MYFLHGVGGVGCALLYVCVTRYGVGWGEGVGSLVGMGASAAVWTGGAKLVAAPRRDQENERLYDEHVVFPLHIFPRGVNTPDQPRSHAWHLDERPRWWGGAADDTTGSRGSITVGQGFVSVMPYAVEGATPQRSGHP